MAALGAPMLQAAGEVEKLIDASRALAPEFAADVLLRIAGQGKWVPSQEERIQFVEEAFRLAAHTQMEWPLHGRGFHTDTRPGWRQFASDTGPNSLDLQTRAIEQMRLLNRARLQSMFAEMRPIPVERASCKEPQRPALEKYYRVMLLVAESGFSAREVSEGEPERWMVQNLQTIRSPSQLSGAARAIPKPSDRVLNALASTLPNFPQDWLAFAYMNADLPLTAQTASTVREYVVRTLEGVRCRGVYSMRAVKDVPVPVLQFNRFVKAHPELQIDPIDPGKVEPSGSEDGYELEEFWKSERSRQVLQDLKWLSHGNRKLPDKQRFWTLEERRTSQWNERYLGLLKLIEGWVPEDEASSTDYFHMRAQTLEVLTRLVPPGMQQKNALGNLISFLNSAYNHIPHAEWFAHVRSLIGNNRSEPWLLDELELHGNAVLSLYSRLFKSGVRW